MALARTGGWRKSRAEAKLARAGFRPLCKHLAFDHILIVNNMSTAILACVDYEDKYVQPLLVAALKARLPAELLTIITDLTQIPTTSPRLLLWQQYEKIDFEKIVSDSTTCLANSYVIRKALIRKHYLAATVSHWLSKNPSSVLKHHLKPTVEFEVDYAEFLDDALVEAFELRESWARNEEKTEEEKEWWILKPGMSDRGQGIRLFSSEDELTEIFEGWDVPSDDEEDEDVDEHEDPLHRDHSKDANRDSGVITSQLRHFVAQPYIDPPLLLPDDHVSANRKFHIRTYVVATGALQVYVYRPMLALFAGQEYVPPSVSANEDLSSHLSNTCLQNGEREGSVHGFWSLPATLSSLPHKDWRKDVFSQICQITGEVFEAAARSMSIHFQPLPNAFEIFGLDFMVDARGTAWLLEVNAFPDFAQTGDELQGLVQRLFEGVVDVAIKPFFAIKDDAEAEGMVEVLDIDLGRR